MSERTIIGQFDVSFSSVCSVVGINEYFVITLSTKLKGPLGYRPMDHDMINKRQAYEKLSSRQRAR